MKISNLTEMATPSSMPDNNTSAPKFGRSDEMLESGVGTTTSGSVPTDPKPMGKMRTRGQGSMFKGISTSSKYANSRKAGISEDSVNEDELSEEQLQAKKRREENFKKAKDRELGNKPQSRDIMTKEEFNGEYDDEAGMFKNNLQTIQRVSTHLEQAIADNENLPEWCQEKIGVAKAMVVTVMDYMISQHENGERPTVDETGPGIPFRGVGGAFNRGDDERHDLDTPKPTAPQVWGLKINGKVWTKAGKSVTFTSKEAALKSRDSILKTRPDLEIGLVTRGGQQGVTESSQRVDSLVTDALKIMRGSGLNDAVQALKTVLGNREYNDRRGHYNFYVKQLMDMYGQQGVAEGSDDKFRAADKVEELVRYYKLFDKRGWTDLFAKLAGRKLQGVPEISREMEYASKFLDLLDSIRMRSDYRGQQDPKTDQELIDLSNQWLDLLNQAEDEFKGMSGQGMAEGSSENKYSNLSNRGVNRGINRAGDDFNRMMDLDQVESPHYKTQHQQDTKQRLKTKPMTGPKGVLPEQGMAEGRFNPDDYHDARTSGDYGMDLPANTSGSSYKEIDKGSKDGQRGRPSTKSLNGISKALPADAFGRTTGKIPASAKPKTKPDPFRDIDEESKGLWANIHAKRERIKNGSGEKMRKPGSDGAPTASALRKSAK